MNIYFILLITTCSTLFINDYYSRSKYESFLAIVGLISFARISMSIVKTAFDSP